MGKIWNTLMWSLKASFEGNVPIHDVHGNALQDGKAGNELAGGLRFVLWSLKADLNHWAKAYGLTRYNSNDPCEFCTASRKGDWKGWHNYFGSDATWKRQYFQHGNGDNCTMNCTSSLSCHICLATIWRWMNCMLCTLEL